MTTPLQLLVERDVDGTSSHAANRAVLDSVLETASQQTADSLTAELGCEADQLVAILRQAADDQQLATELGDDRNANREQLAASLDRLAGDELSTANCEQLATTFVAELESELLSPPADAESTKPGETTLGHLGDTAFQDGALEAAEASYHLTIDLARAHAEAPAEAAGLRSVGNVALQDDDLEAAEEYHRESLDLSREHDLQSIEADSLASLGTVEASRGYPETAETYLAESLDLKRLLDDRVGEATCLASLGNVAESREAFETAIDRYTDALELFSADEPREQLQTLQGLIDAERAVGDETAARSHCEQGLAVLSEADFTDREAYQHWFQLTDAQLTGDRDTLEALYMTALRDLRDNESQVAFELFEGIWEARSAAEGRAAELCLRAGVGFAAAHLLVTDDSIETTYESIVKEIDPQREQLSEPAAALLAFVSTGGETDRTVETADIDDSQTDLDDLDTLERLAYGTFLENLNSAPPPETLYTKALLGIVRDSRSVERVVRLSIAAWNQKAGSDDPRSTVGAGLLVEAHRELFDVELPIDRQAVFDAAASADSLSKPMAALFERLQTGSTDWSASLSVAADDDLSVSEAETLAVDRILSRLGS